MGYYSTFFYCKVWIIYALVLSQIGVPNFCIEIFCGFAPDHGLLEVLESLLCFLYFTTKQPRIQ